MAAATPVSRLGCASSPGRAPTKVSALRAGRVRTRAGIAPSARKGARLVRVDFPPLAEVWCGCAKGPQSLTAALPVLDPLSATNSSAYNFGTGGVQVWECVGQGYVDPGAFCCESRREKTECCRTQDAVFSLPGATLGNANAVQTFPLPDDETDTSDFITTRRPTMLVGGIGVTVSESSPTISTMDFSQTGRILFRGTRNGGTRLTCRYRHDWAVDNQSLDRHADTNRIRRHSLKRQRIEQHGQNRHGGRHRGWRGGSHRNGALCVVLDKDSCRGGSRGGDGNNDSGRFLGQRPRPSYAQVRGI